MTSARFLPALLAAVVPAAAWAAPSPTPSPGPSSAASAAPSPPAGTVEAQSGPHVGSAAPAFSLRTLDGKAVSLAGYRGKTLVINVWATWCPPCRQEMPDLIRAAPAYAKTGDVAFLGVDTTEQAPIVRAYAAAKNVPYALAIDSDKSFEKAYDIQAFPTTYVIDGNGVVRARYVDMLGTKQLAELVAAGRAGRNATIVSPLQGKIDATLADPSITFTSSDPATIEANAKAADAAIRKAEGMLDDSDAASGNSTDFVRTRAEEATLRGNAVAALVNVGTSVKDMSLLPRMRGDAALDAERWADALEAYHAVLQLQPNDPDALAGTSFASDRLEKYDDAVAADATLAKLSPDDVTALVSLALDQNKAGHATESYATFARAVDLAKAHVDALHGSPKSVRTLAYAHMYAGRTYAKNGDAAHARDEFTDMLAWAQKLPPNDERHDMYLEEGQEAIAALGLTSTSALSVSLAPWIGADLPGSVPNTIKYRLVLAGSAGKNVTLVASGLPKAWVASFCSDKVCAPMRTALVIPSSGVKIVEFQLIPPNGTPQAPKVRVTGSDGSARVSATT